MKSPYIEIGNQKMGSKRKSKALTTVLAFFFGGFGIHRFYLGQRGNGVIYIILMFVFGISFLLGFIDFLAFLFMDKDKFDRRYNNVREDVDFNRDSYQRYLRRKDAIRRESKEPGRPYRHRNGKIKKVNPNNTRLKALIQSGRSQYDNFDYFEAISQWEKALEMSPNHIAVHFNLACAYSLTEQADAGFYHLSQAVKNGFKDQEKLKNQDALAFLRIQPGFEDFAANGYQLTADKEEENPITSPAEQAEIEQTSIFEKPDLLQQLKDLGELRDRGLLTNEEFLAEKKKLL